MLKRGKMNLSGNFTDCYQCEAKENKYISAIEMAL